jgi:hypothetical protein
VLQEKNGLLLPATKAIRFMAARVQPAHTDTAAPTVPLETATLRAKKPLVGRNREHWRSNSRCPFIIITIIVPHRASRIARIVVTYDYTSFILNFKFQVFSHVFKDYWFFTKKAARERQHYDQSQISVWEESSLARVGYPKIAGTEHHCHCGYYHAYHHIDHLP